MAHNLREDLVSLWHTNQETYVALSMDSQSAQDLAENLRQAQEIRDEIKKEAANERMKLGKKQASKETRERLAEAKAACKEIGDLLKEAKQQTRDAHRPALDALSKRLEEEEYAARVKAVHNGLFWGTADAVLANHRTARKEVVKKRMKKLPADMRHHRYDGTGTLFAQVKFANERVDKAAKTIPGSPRRIPALFSQSKHRYANVFRSSVPLSESDWTSFRPTGKPRVQRGVLGLGVLPRAVLDVPVVLHRPIPDDAEITNVSITRRKLANKYVISVNLTCNVPDPGDPGSNSAVMVVLQWNKKHGDAVTVANVADTAHLPPRELVERGIVIETDTDGVYQVVCNISKTKHALGDKYTRLDESWIAPLLRSDATRSGRDRDLNDLRTKIKAQLKSTPALAKELGVSVAEVSSWKAFGRFVRLAQMWPDDAPLKQELMEWQRHDKHLWIYQSNEKDQALACRNDCYKKVAEWLTRDAGMVCISGVDIASLKEKKDEDTYADEASRALIQAVAPGFLRQAIAQAAKKRNVKVQLMGSTEIDTDHLIEAINKKGN